MTIAVGSDIRATPGIGLVNVRKTIFLIGGGKFVLAVSRYKVLGEGNVVITRSVLRVCRVSCITY